MIKQTVIPISADDEISLENFYSIRNQPLVEELKSLVSGLRAKRVLYIWGESGSGKSHLLNACCLAAESAGLQNLYISLKQDRERLEKLIDIDSSTLICIDDIQLISGSSTAQNQILSLYENIMNGAGGIIASGIGTLGSIGFSLKDLESRLSSGGSFNIFEMNDDEKRKALKSRAAKRGFALDDSVVQFIMSHYNRDTKSLFALLDKLDSASLQAHRKITVPFVKNLM